MKKIDQALAQLHTLLKPDGRINKAAGVSYDGQPYLDLLPRVKCADGFEVSIQASRSHYCTPRDSFGPWLAVELGYPSKRVPSLKKYRDGDGPDTGTVFGYVPIEKVAALLARHGGIVTANE